MSIPLVADTSYDWLAELPLPLGSPHLRMGLRSLPRDRWLPTDPLTSAELRQRGRLLDEHDDLVMLDAGWDHAVDELLSLMEIHLGRRVERGPWGPLEAAARAVPDDMLLMADSGDGWRLVGGALVFPNHWRLSDKMGGTLTQIHSPVDGYDELLAAKTDRFFDRLTPNRVVWRRNWFFEDDPSFYRPEKLEPIEFAEPERAGGLYIRSEWQTLRRLAFSGVIVFTVKTQMAPTSELAARPDLARRMIDFLEAASPRSLANKQALGRQAAIIEYLRLALPEPALAMPDL